MLGVLRKKVKPVYVQFMLQFHPDYFMGRQLKENPNQKLMQIVQNWLNPLFNSSEENPSSSKFEILVPNSQLKIFTKPKDQEDDIATINMEFDKFYCELKKEFHKNKLTIESRKTDNGDLIINDETGVVGTALFLILSKNSRLKDGQDYPELQNLIQDSINLAAKTIGKNGFNNRTDFGSKWRHSQELRDLRREEANKKKLSRSERVEEELSNILRNSSFSIKNINNLSKYKAGEVKEQLRLDRNQVYFNKRINPKRWAKILSKLEKNLKDLEYEKWRGLPVMFVCSWEDVFTHNHDYKIPGFVTIPVNATTNGNFNT
ncbi:hypothetical protein AYI68_g3804 [Smittium mucronatum]|uniref:DUF4460 domain-containing protein n=1 Tax=Smittium mucronatum TaxID=133383 RepID=A0A1R0GYW3_9FUNG|nr:hypothetical protein AYI68_g3804 [Smittium mucronatum]